MSASDHVEWDPWWRRLTDLRSTIELAELRCTPADELIGRLDSVLHHEYPADAINYLADYPSDDLAITSQIADKLDYLVDVGMKRRGEEGRRVDRALFRLIRLVPPPRARSLGTRLLEGPRVIHRRTGYRALRLCGLDRQLVKILLGLYAEHQDREALSLLAGFADELSAGDCVQLLERSDTKRDRDSRPSGARARLIERLIVVDPALAMTVARKLPAETAWAIGRTRDPQRLSLLRSLYDDAHDDPWFVTFYVWAVGVIGSQADLEPARRLIEVKEAERNSAFNRD